MSATAIAIKDACTSKRVAHERFGGFSVRCSLVYRYYGYNLSKATNDVEPSAESASSEAESA